MNAESGETGNFLCCMSQTYATPSVGTHFALGDNEWVGMAKLPEYGPKYFVYADVRSTSAFTNFAD